MCAAQARGALLEPHLPRMAWQTRSSKLSLVDKPQGKHVKEWDIEGERVVIGIA